MGEEFASPAYVRVFEYVRGHLPFAFDCAFLYGIPDA